jgi:hypothetical protein
MFGKFFSKIKYKTQAEITISLAKTFISYMNSFNEPWDKAYFRFHIDNEHYGCNGSYSLKGNAKLLSVFDHEELYNSLESISLQLHDVMVKDVNFGDFRVALITITSGFDFDIKYEYADINKWKITRIDSNGIPIGLH